MQKGGVGIRVSATLLTITINETDAGVQGPLLMNEYWG